MDAGVLLILQGLCIVSIFQWNDNSYVEEYSW